jgi:RimJ/RimL family protein N-acetyltransferase
MINLNSISEIEFQSYFKATVVSYAEHNVESGRWAKEDASRLAKAELDTMLPSGLDTPNNHIYVVESKDQNISVGYLWVAIDEDSNAKSMFICDVEIHEVFRRKGYAEATFQFLEKHARSLGVTCIRANIFGHNKKAQALSEKLGYQITNVFISKQLS